MPCSRYPRELLRCVCGRVFASGGVGPGDGGGWWVVSANVPDALRAFTLAVATTDDLSVSVEATGEAVVTTTAHDNEDAIAFERVASLAHAHELCIVGGVADFDAGTVEVVVADGSWQRGGQEGGEG